MGHAPSAWRFGVIVICLALAPLMADIMGQSAWGQETEAEAVGPYPGTVSWQSDYSFHELVGRLQKSIAVNGMTLVATTSAMGHGSQIPDNTILMVSRNDYALRMIEANILSGVETPIRLYVTAGINKKANITYRTPTSIFALYDNPKLDELAAELDQIFAKIIDDALSR
jgi:uncharacterized protein (DUF302 family)